MGDLAVGLVERSLALMRQPELPTGDVIYQIANLVESMVLTSLDAFVQRDAKRRAISRLGRWRGRAAEWHQPAVNRSDEDGSSRWSRRSITS